MTSRIAHLALAVASGLSLVACSSGSQHVVAPTSLSAERPTFARLDDDEIVDRIEALERANPHWEFMVDPYGRITSAEAPLEPSQPGAEIRGVVNPFLEKNAEALGLRAQGVTRVVDEPDQVTYEQRIGEAKVGYLIASADAKRLRVIVSLFPGRFPEQGLQPRDVLRERLPARGAVPLPEHVRERIVPVVKSKRGPVEMRRALCTDYGGVKCVDVYSGEDISAEIPTVQVKIERRGSTKRVTSEVTVRGEHR